MPWLLIVLLALHAITAVFWAGSTFVLARGTYDSAHLARPQLGAATFAIITGALLFWLAHSSGVGPMETALIIGAVCALLAAIAQGWMRRTNPLLSQRIAAPLLVITVICMVTARYWS
jgi:hypothetical protein